jgi:flagellar hook protein FlgE
MSLSSAMFASVTGLDTASTAISVIGDNIANVSTPGFKERRAEFADVLGQSLATSGGFAQTGAGSSILNVSQIFSQGAFESTARVTDMAIEGQGFFVLDGVQGRSYSRAGMFSFDRNGLLTDPLGLRVQGYGIDPVTLLPTSQIGDIQINNAVSPPRASSTMQLSLNLDANAPILAFDPANTNGSTNFQVGISLYDTLGNAHQSEIFFNRTGPNSWSWNATLPPADTSLPPAGPNDTVVVQGSGTLTFDNTGNLTGMTGSPLNYQFSGGAAASQSVAIGFGPIAGAGTGTPTTQFGSASSGVNSKTQDGFPPGTLTSLAVDRSGFLTATFSNGETRPIAQVALATFPATEGLQAIGNNNWTETRESGQPLIGNPRTSQFGSIRASSIEQSNVDLAAQFVRLILQQRAFQANTRTVSTTNELLANLVQLGQ